MSSVTDRLADQIVAYLRDLVSVNLVGLHGSGCTRVADQVADRLRESGQRVVVIRGVAALRDRPLAVLALAGVDTASVGAALAIPRAVQALCALLPQGRSALVLDDADDLDSASAGVIAAAQADRRFPVLAVTRPAGRHQSPNHALVDNLRPGVRLAVAPLGFDQLHQVVHDLLPGPVEPSTVARIATLSGGLPGLVSAIIDSGRRTGTLAEQRGLWRATGDLWDPRLAHVVEPLLTDLTEDESAALTRLSLAGTVPVPEARRIGSDPLFRQLGERGLLEVVDTPAGPLAGVFPPLVAEYLRRTHLARSGGPARTDTDGPGDGTTPAPVSREALSGSLVTVINTRIQDRRRIQVGVLKAAWQTRPTAENATALLEALNEASAGPGEFETVLRGTRPGRVDTIASVRLLGWEALYRGVLLRQPDAARASLARRREEAPAFAAQLRAAEASLCLASGLVPDAVLLRPLDPPADPEAAETLDRARRLTLIYAGRTTDAMAGLPDDTTQLTDYPETLRVAVVLARVFDGDFDAGLRMAAQGMAQGEDRLSAGQILEYAYSAGMALVFSGRLAEAQALLDPVLALTGPTMMHEYYHAGVLGLAALSAGWRGQASYFDSLTAQTEAVGRRSGPFPDILRPSRATLGGGTESAEAAGEAAWAVAAERFATGHVAAGVTLAVAAVEAYPDPAAAELAVQYAAGTQSPFLAALGHYIEAAAAGDPDRLADCVVDLRRRGATLYSVKAAVTRALKLRSRGDLAGAARQAEAAWAEAGEPGPVPLGLFHPLGRATRFNAREAEIAGLLADGLTSQSIAAMLGLSLRTVENYLSSAYRKLGVTGRADLIRAVTTWASAR